MKPPGTAGYGLTGSRRIGLTSATMGQFMGLATISLFGPTAVVFQRAMILSPIEVALLVSIPVVAGSLLRVPFGAWADSAGGRTPMLIVLGVSSVAMAAITIILFLDYPMRLTHSLFPLFLLLGCLVGVGAAAFSIGVPQASYWYPLNRQGYVLGIYSGIGGLAPGLITLALPPLLTFTGPAYAYLIWLILSLAVLLAYFLIAKDAFFFQLLKKGVNRERAVTIAKDNGQELVPSYNAFRSLRAPLSNLKNWGLVVANTTAFGGYVALTTWLPTYWALDHGVGIIDAGIIASIGFIILGTIIRVPAGSLSDRYGGEAILFYSSLLMLAGSIIFLTNGFALDVAGEIILGIGVGVNSAATFKLVPKYSKSNIGGATGWVSGLGVFGGLVITVLLGAFVNLFGYRGYSLGFTVYVGLSIVSLIIGVIFIRLSKV
ncbi:MAG: MFS transporter [Thaumarchaeota archaeon]|nr:MFS transporter [Nitrososphaerota archaeon]